MDRKRIIAIVSLCICLAVGALFLIKPMLNRGKLTITIDNQSAQELVLIGINEQEFDIMITPGESCKVKYDVKYAAGVGIKLKHDNAVISKELEEYVEPAYYGTIKVIITETLENELEIEVKSRVDF